MKKRIGLILPANLEYARGMLTGASEWAFSQPEVELHLLDDQGTLPPPDLLNRNFDGLLCFSYSDHFAEMKTAKTIQVYTSNRVRPEHSDLVISDDEAVGRMAAEHFIRRGYRDLVYAGRSGHQYSDERGVGFVAAAEEAGLSVHCFDMAAASDQEVCDLELPRLRPRSGVFAANDILARTLMHFTEHPLQRIPLHFALLGVDDDPMQRALCPLPLSSIELDGRQVGYRAMERILARIHNPELPLETIRVPPLRLHTRHSTDIYALEDELAARTLEVMDEHLQDLPDVAGLIDLLHVPRRTLEQRFRKATGRTLARELAILRIERARDLLRNSSDTVEEIAQSVGLPEARMLWMLFKRHCEETPSAYRKRMQQNLPPLEG